MKALQLLVTFTNEPDARSALDSLRDQDGFLGGRVLPANPVCPRPRVQAFFQDEPDLGWLPDDVRRVIIPDGQRRMLGLA